VLACELTWDGWWCQAVHDGAGSAGNTLDLLKICVCLHYFELTAALNVPEAECNVLTIFLVRYVMSNIHTLADVLPSKSTHESKKTIALMPFGFRNAL
jgi:hypothetical protein